jgi:ABC-type proline/glycine betaine transport system substrate-binding protein
MMMLVGRQRAVVPTLPVMCACWCKGTLAERAPDVVDLLTAMDMDMQAVSAVLVAIEDESLTPDEAAVRWLRDNPNVWSQWVNDDVAERINQALAETS